MEKRPVDQGRFRVRRSAMSFTSVIVILTTAGAKADSGRVAKRHGVVRGAAIGVVEAGVQQSATAAGLVVPGQIGGSHRPCRAPSGRRRTSAADRIRSGS